MCSYGTVLQLLELCEIALRRAGLHASAGDLQVLRVAFLRSRSLGVDPDALDQGLVVASGLPRLMRRTQPAALPRLQRGNPAGVPAAAADPRITRKRRAPRRLEPQPIAAVAEALKQASNEVPLLATGAVPRLRADDRGPRRRPGA